MELIHCPTERILSDFYTKPLQGSLFIKIRDIIMGLTPFSEEGRVVNSEKILTENISKQIRKKHMYADVVRYQPYENENHRKSSILSV